MSGEKMFLVCLLIACAASQSSTCPGVNCGPATGSPQVCATALNTTTFMSYATACPSGQSCNSGSSPQYPPSMNYYCSNNSSPVPTPIYSILPGLKSSNATLCRSGSVSGGYCTGNATGVACSSTSDCQGGLWCNSSNLCSPTLAYGASCAVGSAPCKRGSTCVGGICLKYYSLDNGKQLASCASHGFSTYCSSGACSTLSNGTAICVSAMSSSTSVPTSCNSSSTCVSTKVSATDSTTSGFCACGLNPTGASYCTLFPGDKWPSKLTSATISWMGNSNYDSCNMNVLDPECAMNRWSSSSYNNWNYYSYMSSNQIQMVNAPACVLSVFYPQYAAILAAYGGSWALIASALIINILV